MDGGDWRRGRAEGPRGRDAADAVLAEEAVVGEADLFDGAAEGLEAALGVVGGSERGERRKTPGFDAAGEDVVCGVCGGGMAGDVPVELDDGGRGEIGHHPERKGVGLGHHRGE